MCNVYLFYCSCPKYEKGHDIDNGICCRYNYLLPMLCGMQASVFQNFQIIATLILPVNSIGLPLSYVQSYPFHACCPCRNEDHLAKPEWSMEYMDNCS